MRLESFPRTGRWALWLAGALACAVGGCDDEAPVVVDGGPGGGGSGGVGGGAGGAGGCIEGDTYCDGIDEMICRSGVFVPSGSDACAPDICQGPGCGDDCAAAADRRAYLGCEFWPVDLDNAVEITRKVPANGECPEGSTVSEAFDVCQPEGASAWLCDPDGTCEDGSMCGRTPVCVQDGQNAPFAVVVSNPSTDAPVAVTLEGPGGQLHQEMVAPGAVATLRPADLGWPDASVDHTSQAARAYRLTADSPIVAYQFNPLDNVGVFSNDGSLLLPSHAYDTVYYAISQPTLDRSPVHDFSGYVTVVASAAGTTPIRVTPTVEVRAGAQIPAIPAGMAREFELQQGEVLNLEAVGNADLTGTRIEAVDGRTPFGVFVGHEAIGLTDLQPNVCCADHIEEQLFPASAWGLRFAIARTQPRVELRRQVEVPDMLRVMALQSDTAINFDPPARDRQGRERPVCRVGTGEWCDFFIDVDTLINADKPILVAHFLTSAGAGSGASPVGDPGLAFAPPFEQFRDDYTFLVPAEYDAQYISVVAEVGGAVSLDGDDVGDRLTPFASGSFRGGRIPVEPGTHRLDCPGGCGLLVYGYAPAVSYLFAGGLDLRQITVP